MDVQSFASMSTILFFFLSFFKCKPLTCTAPVLLPHLSVCTWECGPDLHVGCAFCILWACSFVCIQPVGLLWRKPTFRQAGKLSLG
ncbi:hypothetical protein NC652_031368 [Populus alba x Populus x berolinensis]|nr:hypothetical protein NC652_031368 [Populus alba x Populus x berolinensis]